ncbi:universal stress protein [Halovivax gelatinilyticus]|uniref:universal stress protein n=1 Tax=Halovivax gelatinilyticus TaxID=2961597 RepID=UPI0020CA8C8B|nr:universal stress protein [Halovivax gelatinilyticus]
MSDPDRVLVVTLGEPDDRRALRHALETYPEAVVTLLAIVVPADLWMSEGRILERRDERLSMASDRAASLRETVCEESDRDPSTVGTLTREGSPAEVVSDAVDELDCDLVVVPGHDASAIERWLLGDGIPRTIEKQTSVPVTVLE